MKWDRQTVIERKGRSGVITLLWALALMACSQIVVAANIEATPTSLDFGSLRVGQQSAFQPIDLFNNDFYGAHNIVIDASLGFVINDNCPSVLSGLYGPGGPRSCIINVAFAPELERIYNGWIRVRYDDGVGGPTLTTQIDLTAEGLPAAFAELSVTPTTLDFGLVQVGQSSAPQPVMISNTGTADLQLDQPLNVGDQFSETNDCAAVNWLLIPGASCTASVVFSPTVENDAVAQPLQVSGVDVNSKTPLSVSASMLGIATPMPAAVLTVTPYSLSFGTVGLNESSTPQPVTLSNTGTGPMDLDPVTVSGDFSQTSDCGSELGEGASCVVNVVFNPLTGGSLTGLLNISGLDQGTGEILSSAVELQGFGLDISLEASPAALSFGGTLPQAVSEAQSVTITNRNDVGLVLDQLLVSDQFMRTGGDCSGALAPNDSCVVEIAFAPQDAGSIDGELLIAATDSSGGVSVSNIVSLTGSTMGLASAEAILSQVNVGGNPNVISVIGVIADTCTSGRASPRLQEDCNAVIDAAASGDDGVIQALNEITPERAIKSSRLTQQGGQVQMSNVASRIAALRNGATGISFGGLGFDINGKQLSATQLASMGQANARGGSAGEDDGMFGSRLGGFVTGTISTGDKEGTDLDSGLEFSTSGITAGLDYRVTDTLVLGGAIGYMSTDSDLDNSGGNVDAAGYTLTAYGTYYGAQSYYVDFSAAYGSNSFDQQRKVAYVLQDQGIIDQKAKADYDGDMFTFSVGTGYDFNSGGWTFGPRANLDYIKADVDGFTEKMSDPLASGGGWATSIKDTDQTWLTMKLGGKVAYAYSASWGVLTPYAGADWLHEFQNDSQLILGGFAEDPGSLNFRLQTEDPDRNYFRVNFGVAAVFQNGIIGYVDYDTILSNERWDRQTISAGLRMEF